MASIKKRLVRATDAVICFVRKTWRPFMLVGVAVGTWVNLVVIPIATWTVPDLSKAALWIGACGALQWVRAWEKVRGATE